jgi:hypothetical protein
MKKKGKCSSEIAKLIARRPSNQFFQMKKQNLKPAKF